jgi:hypothetical protein
VTPQGGVIEVSYEGAIRLLFGKKQQVDVNKYGRQDAMPLVADEQPEPKHPTLGTFSPDSGPT